MSGMTQNCEWFIEKLGVAYHKGLSFISNRQRRKEGTFCASELSGIEPTPPAPNEQGMPAFANLSQKYDRNIKNYE
jgi:hypothetical protein